MSDSDKLKVDVVDLSNCVAWVSPEKPLTLGQLWQRQTIVMIFLRHFACIACRAHASQVWSERHKYEANGAKIIFIGNGQPHFIEKFREDLGIEKGVTLTDPTLKSFKVAGFKRGLFNLIQPRSLVNAAQLAAEGHKQTAYTKDAGVHTQMGGILVINPMSKILYHYASEALGDIPKEPYIDIIQRDEENSRKVSRV